MFLEYRIICFKKFARGACETKQCTIAYKNGPFESHPWNGGNDWLKEAWDITVLSYSKASYDLNGYSET